MEETKWEYILDGVNTRILKVIGGWVILHETSCENDEGYMIPQSESMCFIPDPEHLWK